MSTPWSMSTKNIMLLSANISEKAVRATEEWKNVVSGREVDLPDLD